VAVLYAETLSVDPPKAGVSTLPNSRCGGIRISDQPSPPSGLIVVTEARQPETLAHEMGHYLGLCHTFEQVARFAVQNTSGVSDCERTGDGICDTPVDPGIPACFRTGFSCELECHAGEHPDASNIMSYYIGCRRALTQEQLAEAARNLALRRGWFRCLDPRDCPCDPTLKTACPLEMSCHPAGSASNESGFACELDGSGEPGTFCKAASQCSARALCVGGSTAGSAGRCVRPCDGEPGCTCMDVGLGLRACAEDLR
jgi:Pregnancy-associated plasma protein-A